MLQLCAFARRVSCSWKQQPDKAQTEMSVPCPFFISQQIASCEIKSLRRDGYFFVVSVARGLVISGCLILFLPMLFRTESLWLAMPVTELLAAFFCCNPDETHDGSTSGKRRRLTVDCHSKDTEYILRRENE